MILQEGEKKFVRSSDKRYAKLKNTINLPNINHLTDQYDSTKSS